MKNIFCVFAFILSATICMATNVYSEDLKAIFTKVDTLVAEGNYTKALEELGWAKKEIEKLNSQKLAALLPETLAGLKGGKTETNSALGITAIEKQYSTGDSMTVKVTDKKINHYQEFRVITIVNEEEGLTTLKQEVNV